jgi:hypothetical protein
MRVHVGKWNPQSLEVAKVVEDFICALGVMVRTADSVERMPPTQERQAEHFAIGLSVLLVDDPFFAATESTAVWIESKPRIAPASE